MQEQAGVSSDLSVAKNVADGYVHSDKFIAPDENIALQGAWLKWYNVAVSESPVPTEIRQLARDFLQKESTEERLDVSGDLGFVILHRCGADFYFLIVATWRNENELWESVYAKDGPNQVDFGLFPFPTSHRGTFCVWELGAVWHERQAWRRYLLSTRDNAARLTYLSDCFEGEA